MAGCPGWFCHGGTGCAEHEWQEFCEQFPIRIGCRRQGRCHKIDTGYPDFKIRVPDECHGGKQAKGRSLPARIPVGRFLQNLRGRTGIRPAHLEGPKSLNACGVRIRARRRLSGTCEDFFLQQVYRCGGERLFVFEVLPGQLGSSHGDTAQMGHQLLFWKFGEIRNRESFLFLPLQPPDATALFITVGVIAGDFVVADNFVIPIDNINRAIRSEGHAHWAEPFIPTGHHIRQPLQAPTAAVAVHFDSLNAVNDRIGHQHDVRPFRRKGAGSIREGQTAQASASHAELSWIGKFGSITFPLGIGTSGIVGVFMERHHGITKIVGFLDKGLSLTIHGEAPDIAGTVAGDGELRAVGAEFAHPGLVKGGYFSLRAHDLAVIESPLRHPDPASRSAGKLMRKKMGILHPKTCQDNVPFICFAIAVRVLKKDDIMSVLGIAAVPVRKQAEGNGQSIRENGRFPGITDRVPVFPPVFNIINEDAILGFARVERIGSGGILIGIDRIFTGRHGPEPSALVKLHSDKFSIAFFHVFFHDQFHLQSWSQGKGRAFILRSEW